MLAVIRNCDTRNVSFTQVCRLVIDRRNWRLGYRSVLYGVTKAFSQVSRGNNISIMFQNTLGRDHKL